MVLDIVEPTSKVTPAGVSSGYLRIYSSRKVLKRQRSMAQNEGRWMPGSLMSESQYRYGSKQKTTQQTMSANLWEGQLWGTKFAILDLRANRYVQLYKAQDRNSQEVGGGQVCNSRGVKAEQQAFHQKTFANKPKKYVILIEKI